MSSPKHQAIIALIFANVIWGAASPIIKWSLTDIHPLTLAFFRFFLATLLLLPFCINNLAIKKKDIHLFIIMAFFGITLNIGLYFIALTFTDSINSPLIGSSVPILVIIASIFFLHQKANLRIIAGSFIALLGILVILLEPIIEKGLTGTFTGNMLLVIASFCGVVHIFTSTRLSQTYRSITITFYSFLLGAASFTPFFLFEVGKYGLPTLTMQSGIGVLYTAVLSSCLAHLLFYKAERSLKPQESALFNYIPPVIAILVAVPLLGEKVTPLFLLGGILVFLGLYIAKAHHKVHGLHHHR